MSEQNEKAPSGRINTKITFGYEAVNDQGVKTIEMTTTTLTIRDQSGEEASAHLLAMINGLLAPSSAQASGSLSG